MDAKKIIEMKQERAQLTASMRQILNDYEDKLMPADKKEEYEKQEKRFDEINDLILREEKQLERERAAGEIEDKTKVTRKGEPSLFAKALTGNPDHIAEFKASMSLGNDSQAGSLTAPMEFRNELIKGLDDMLWMRQISRNVGPIGAGQSLGYPYRATEAADAEWVGEVAASPEETTLSYGRREFKPNRMAKLIKLSTTLVSHAPTAERTVREEMEYRIGITQEKAYMSGTGVSQPLGIFTASDSGISTSRDISDGNTASGVTFDGLMNAKYSLKEQYLRESVWVMHRDLAKMLAKLKDTEGQYIWQPSVALGQPDTLLGHRVHMSEYAPNTYTTGKYAAVFGDFKYYWICDADNLTVQVLNELYAPNNQIGYLYNYFGDGAPVVGEAFARVKLG